MTDSNNVAVSLTTKTIADGYGDNTVVWIPAGIIANSTTDIAYTVNLTRHIFRLLGLFGFNSLREYRSDK